MHSKNSCETSRIRTGSVNRFRLNSDDRGAIYVIICRPNMIDFVVDESPEPIQSYRESEIHRSTGHLACDSSVKKNPDYLGKASQHQVRRVSGKATRMPDIRGECKIIAAGLTLAPKSTVGAVPIDWPYKMTCRAEILYLVCKAFQAASTSAYKFFSLALPLLAP
uniref:Uncharacterized protein n=1 Tax=Romanomermis culicivorax TaxID=13658 RepID=A0A915KEU2_ROMCU